LCSTPGGAYSPSQRPLGCPVAPPSQRVASCAKTAAAAAVAWQGGRAPHGIRRPIPAPRPVERPPQRPPPRPASRPSRACPSRVAQGQREGRHACVVRGFRRWKMTRATINTFKLPSSAALDKPSATSCAASFTCLFLTCSSFTCHLRASVTWVPPLTDDDPSSVAPSTSSATSCITSPRPAPRPSPSRAMFNYF